MIVVESLGLLFLHVPQTGGTAIRNHLVDSFDGVTAGPYHGHLARHLEPTWRGGHYTTIATVRNPLDATVSSHFKQRTDHKGWYSSGKLGERRVAQAANLVENDLDFGEWFLRYRRRVFAPSWLYAVRRADHVMRFESLAGDLANALTRIGVTDPPPLPVDNLTARPAEIDDLYRNESVRRRSHHVFAPFMAEFGYDFPADWPPSVPMTARLEYGVGRRLVAPGD